MLQFNSVIFSPQKALLAYDSPSEMAVLVKAAPDP